MVMNKRNLFTSSSKENFKFIGKLFLFFLMVIGYINLILPQYEGGYNAGLVDKAARLKSIHVPKIVLLSNSNVAFGIDSAMIEESLEMPVVNMGLHGGNGNAFHEEMAKLNVNEGDIYVICHSDFSGNSISDAMVAWTSIENHYELWKLLRFGDFSVMSKGFPTYLKKSLCLYASGTGNELGDGVYSRSAFNQYGDIGIYREDTIYSFTQPVSPPAIDDMTIERLNKLNKYLEERGAVLLIAGYPIGNGGLTEDVQKFMDFQEELENRLDCPVISNYVNYMFDYSYFYDTNLHLTTLGAQVRTRQLIEDIKKWQGADAQRRYI